MRTELPSCWVLGFEIRVVARRGPWLLVFHGDIACAIFIREVGHRERAASSRLGARAAILLRIVVLVGKGTIGVGASRAVGRSSVLHLRLYPNRRSKWAARSWCSCGRLVVGALHRLLRSLIISHSVILVPYPVRRTLLLWRGRRDCGRVACSWSGSGVVSLWFVRGRVRRRRRRSVHAEDRGTRGANGRVYYLAAAAPD